MYSLYKKYGIVYAPQHIYTLALMLYVIHAEVRCEQIKHRHYLSVCMCKGRSHIISVIWRLPSWCVCWISRWYDGVLCSSKHIRTTQRQSKLSTHYSIDRSTMDRARFRIHVGDQEYQQILKAAYICSQAALHAAHMHTELKLK